jgi:hypothetical protein
VVAEGEAGDGWMDAVDAGEVWNRDVCRTDRDIQGNVDRTYSCES